ncbi:glycoside hydrolase family 3 C-terminal domain-containing protein [Angustibacter luteus]|uniref:Glycoside hydrolase family 3 C-terminal domain-containing protein n=1 Tax=Angustibacter luteus TaxID=658456 RepID=A0ABW1JDA8_9ACTN
MTVTDLATALADLAEPDAWQPAPAPVPPDCLTGFAAWRATAFPTPLGWAATFDPALVHELAAAVARSMTDVGVHQGQAPVLEVCRDPRWGRTEETLGEDAYLVDTLGAAYTAGLESGGVAVSARRREPDAVQPLRAPDLDSPWLRSLAARMAERSIVLLENDGLLPLPAPASVAVVGPCADEVRSLVASNAFPRRGPARVGAGRRVETLVQALRQEWPRAQMRCAAGVSAERADVSGVPAAAALAASADVCVLAVGDVSGPFGVGTSGEGCDVGDLRLPGAQHELVEAVLATGTPTVLVLLSGRPYALGEYVGRVGAIVQAFFPGRLGAQAVAGVLSGLVNPSGHLPVAIPTTRYGLGHGLSYTSFTLRDLTVDVDQVPAAGQVQARLLVTNDGGRRGEDVVQLYVDRRLVGFARVPLAAGQTRELAFTLPAGEPGRFELHAADTGGMVQDGPTAQFAVVGPPRISG